MSRISRRRPGMMAKRLRVEGCILADPREADEVVSTGASASASGEGNHPDPYSSLSISTTSNNSKDIGNCRKRDKENHNQNQNVETSPNSEDGTSTSNVHDVIPGLPQEISLWILARIPRSFYGRFRQVSKAWREILGPSLIYRIRQELCVLEEWVYMGTSGHTRGQDLLWKALDTTTLQWLVLPNLPRDVMFQTCDRECTVAGRQLLVVGQTMDSTFGCTKAIIYMYDSDVNGWSVAQSMKEQRSLFASASYGKYAWVAGGVFAAGGPMAIRKSAERFSSETREWELLEDMHFPRRECSGFFMDKHFYVLGGMTMNEAGQLVQLSSGEFYDPETRRWTLVEGMWPDQMPHANLGQYAPPLVAVVDDQLYALDASCLELKSYDKQTKEWSSLGKVPSRGITNNGWGLGFRSLGGELWVIGGQSLDGPVPHIDACKPDPSGGPLAWRRVANTETHFISNVAVMKS